LPRAIGYCGALLTVVCLAGPASAQQGAAKIWFAQGEQLRAVNRPAASAEEAVQALLAGPTAAEKKLGFRSYVPVATQLNTVTVANGLATVDLSLQFGLGDDPASLDARVSQLVHTLVGIEGARRVRLLLDGGVPLGMFPGISTAQPLTLKYLDTPDVPATKAAPPPVEATKPVAGLRATQEQLAALGFMVPADVDGENGPETMTAVLAFQKWEGLDREGVLRTGEKYGIALPKGSDLLPLVDAALGRLVADGTIGRLQRKWLTTDVSKLPVLG
jgi:sporulation and spore germination protein/putative peptidoglycan binding protein